MCCCGSPVRNALPKMAMLLRIESRSGSSSHCRQSTFWAFSASWPHSSSVVTVASMVASSVPASEIASTKPQSRAVLASIVAPVITSQRVRPLPISRGRRAAWITEGMPTFTSGMANFAVDAAMRKSQAAATSRAPPRHQQGNAGDHRNRKQAGGFAQCAEAGNERFRRGLIEPRHLLDVGAADEGLVAFGAEHQDADAVVLGEFLPPHPIPLIAGVSRMFAPPALRMIRCDAARIHFCAAKFVDDVHFVLISIFVRSSEGLYFDPKPLYDPDHLQDRSCVTPKTHKAETHAKIVKHASSQLREKGTRGIGVADLMKEAGLTHGGFYAHFGSREDLVIEAIAHAMDQTTARWGKLVQDKPADERLAMLVDSYLTAQHRDGAARGCAIPVACGRRGA